MEILSIKNLNKNFGRAKVLNDINIGVKNNKITAIIGPNGSGKTTLFRSISGCFGKIDGKSILNLKTSIELNVDMLLYKSNISYLQDIDSIDYNLTGIEFIGLICNLYPQIDRPKKDVLIKELLELFDMTSVSNKKLSEMSHGMIRKIMIVAYFVNVCPILILDEPFNGLDSEFIEVMKKILIKLKSTKTIIISSHNLNYVQEIADEIIILKKGSVVYQGEVQKLLENFKSKDLAKSWLEILKISGDKESQLSNVIKLFEA